MLRTWTILEAAKLMNSLLLLAEDSQFIYERIENGALDIGYRAWVPASLFCLLAALAVFGWIIRKQTFLGLGPFIAFAGLAIMLPSVFLFDRATVNEDGMILRTGLFSQHEHQFEYDEIGTVHLTESTFENQEGVREHHDSMFCETRQGTTGEFRVSDRLDRNAIRYFLAEIQRRGIPVVNHRDPESE